MALVIDLIDWRGLNDKAHYECHPKKIKAIATVFSHSFYNCIIEDIVYQ